MRTREELARDPARCRGKALGCLAGLAIGDSLGDQARSPENHIRYGITRDLHASGRWSTDDTEFALLGALAGARRGASAIPADWIEKTRRPGSACPSPPDWISWASPSSLRRSSCRPCWPRARQ